MANMSGPNATANLWRNVTSPAMKSKERGKVSVYHGVFNSDELLDFSSGLNVRREKGGSVKKAILNTLEDMPDSFRYLNGGITIVTRAVVTRDLGGGKVECSFHNNASIINGSQTQGALRSYHGYNDSGELNSELPVEVDVYVIETDDDDLITEITVARNVQNTVKDISVFGRRGAFEDLNKVLTDSKHPVQLATSETDKGYFDTGKAIQLLFALMPEKFWEENISFPRNRPSIYSSKAKWLKYYGKEFTYPSDEEKFNNILDFAKSMLIPAIDLYLEARESDYWGLKHWRTKGIIRSESGIRVTDGYLFPFISAHSVFVNENSGSWSLDLPDGYDPRKIVARMKKIYDMGDEYKNVQDFGKSPLIYEMLDLTAEKMKL